MVRIVFSKKVFKNVVLVVCVGSDSVGMIIKSVLGWSL